MSDCWMHETCCQAPRDDRIRALEAELARLKDEGAGDYPEVVAERDALKAELEAWKEHHPGSCAFQSESIRLKARVAELERDFKAAVEGRITDFYEFKDGGRESGKHKEQVTTP